jgi:ergothioneine biosynthesis protein EgtB
MPDASPTRWHIAHTTWFFETFLLQNAVAGYKPFHPAFVRLFNSYYNAVGEQFPRAQRGVLSRPTVAEVLAYRDHVDRCTEALLLQHDGDLDKTLAAIVEMGLHHEQQHQELMLTDIKHAFSCNPMLPAYRRDKGPVLSAVPLPMNWVAFEGGLRALGFAGEGFCFDNELPRQQAYVAPFELADRLVTNAEFAEFIADDGYERPEHWLSDGWKSVQSEGWRRPLYWRREGHNWREFTLHGELTLDPAAPVCHVSFFEADAFARWAGARLPSEAEWEFVAQSAEIAGNFVESERLHPSPAVSDIASPNPDRRVHQLFGDVWEWTGSAYLAYPGYRPAAGALGEYNGKFMCNQFVLRGGSCATPVSHIRATYRNFFPPAARWQFTGIRLAR